MTDRCALTFDPRTANGHLFLSQELRKAEHLTSGPRPVPAHEARFDHTWQVLCFQGFTRGQHYWELEVSKPWAYLGVRNLACRVCVRCSFESGSLKLRYSGTLAELNRNHDLKGTVSSKIKHPCRSSDP